MGPESGQPCVPCKHDGDAEQHEQHDVLRCVQRDELELDGYLVAAVSVWWELVGVEGGGDVCYC